MATINIDSTYLSVNGPAPYFLSSTGSTYILQTDVTVTETAFIVNAKNVVLDLNGHTITYDNSAPITVPNGGFESGTSPTDIPNWDVTGAPAALRVAARLGMWGSWMLEMAGITTTQTIISDPISIPTANVQYTAVVTPRSEASGSAEVWISLVDNVTQSVLGSWKSDDPASGYASVATMVPTTTNAVRIKIEVIPSGTATVDLDYVALTRSEVYGIISAGSATNLPSYITSAYPWLAASLSSNTGGFTVRNGSIVQGTGRSYMGCPIFAEALNEPGLDVENVTINGCGMNTNFINGRNLGPLVINNSTFIGTMDRISNRKLIFAAIKLDSAWGTISIQNCNISGTMHEGIFLTRPSSTNTESVLIRGNTISHSALGADGYGIDFTNVANFEIDHNTITPVSGRGIKFDGFNSGVTQNGLIHDNTIEVWEMPNLEYGFLGNEATALRMRNYNGAHKNLTFTNNTIAAFTGPGYVWAAIGVRITANNAFGQMDGVSNLFQGNTFKAIVTTPNPAWAGTINASQAWGLTFAGMDSGPTYTFKDNNCVSNITPLNFGDSDSWQTQIYNVLLVSNTVVMDSTSGAVPNSTGLRSFVSVGVGDWHDSIIGIDLIDTRYQSGAPPGVTNLNVYGDSQSVNLGWLLSVTVTTDGVPTAGASVSVLDRTSTQVYSGTTNSSGQVTGVPIITAVIVPSSDPSSPTSTDSRGPFTLDVTSGSDSSSQPFSMAGNLDLSVVFGTPPTIATGRGSLAAAASVSLASLYINDTFTGSAVALESHTPNTGGAYSVQYGGAGVLALDGSGHMGMATPTVVNGSIGYKNATVPPTADVQINFTLLMNSGNSGRGQAGVQARASSDGNTGYAMFLEFDTNTGGSQWLLWSFTPSANTLVRNYPIPNAELFTTYANNATVNCIYRIHGSTHSLTVNGIDLFFVNDSSISASGYTGFYYALAAGGGANHVKFDSWSVTNVLQSIASITQGVTGSSYDMTMTGIDTSWTSGTTFNVTGGTGAGISNLSVNVGTQVASFTLTTGSTPGTFLIGNSSDSTTATIIILTPTAQIDQIAITPSGNIVVMHCANLSNVPTQITSYSGGITIQINGGTPIPLDSSVTPIGFGSTWFWSSLNRRCEMIVDDSDTGFAATGTGWASRTPTGFWAEQAAVWFKGTRQLTTTATDTAVYTFTGVIPGAPYRIQVNGPIATPGEGIYCTQATYVVHDGATVVGTFTQNQDTVSILEFDWADGNDGTLHNAHFYNLGTTSTVTGTTLTVTLSNGAGSGTLVADAVRIERLISLSTGGTPIVHPGDTVTLSAPGGCILTQAGYTDSVTNAPVTLWNDTALCPYNTSIANTMQMGYNLCTLGPDLISTPIYADRLRSPDMFGYGATGWTVEGGSGTFTVDSAGQLTGTTAGCHVKLPVSFVLQNRIDNFSLPLYPRSGLWTLICKTTGSPALTLFGGGNLIFDSAGLVQVATFTDSMGTWSVYTQNVSINDSNPNYGDLIYLGLQSASGGGFIRYPRLYGPELYTTLSTNGWVLSSKFHPNTLDWIKGRNISCLRFLNRVGQGNNFEFNDIVPRYTVAEGTFDARISVAWRTSVPGEAVASIGPIDTNPSTDIDTAYTWFSPANTYYPIVKITTTAPHGFTTGQIVSISSLPGTSYKDNYGGDIGWYRCYTSVVLSPTTLLAMFYVADRTSTKPSNLLSTISTTDTPGGIVYADGVGNCFPWEDIIGLCNECNIVPHVCLYSCETDDCVNKRFQFAAANLKAGLKVRAEWTNEVWNYISGLNGVNLAAMYAYKYFNSTSSYVGYSYISFRMRAIAYAGWTGVPAVFINGNGIGAVAHATVFGGTVTSIVIDHGGSGYTTATVSIIGGAGSGASANATISSGAITGVTGLVGGSGYTLTGRSSSDIIWVMNTAYQDSSYTSTIGSYCGSHNLTDPFEIGIAPYQDNAPASAIWVSHPIADNAYSTLDIDGLIDIYACHAGLAFHDSPPIWAYGTHVGAIKAHGFDVITNPTRTLATNQTRIMGYEGGTGFLCAYGNEDQAHLILRSIAVSHHRRIRLVLRSFFQNVLQATGFVLLNSFQFSDLGNPGVATWTDKDTWNMSVGTADGTDGKYNNANPFQFDRIVSPKGYAIREFVNPPTTRTLLIGVA